LRWGPSDIDDTLSTSTSRTALPRDSDRLRGRRRLGHPNTNPGGI